MNALLWPHSWRLGCKTCYMAWQNHQHALSPNGYWQWPVFYYSEVFKHERWTQAKLERGRCADGMLFHQPLLWGWPSTKMGLSDFVFECCNWAIAPWQRWPKRLPTHAATLDRWPWAPVFQVYCTGEIGQFGNWAAIYVATSLRFPFFRQEH